MHTRILSFVNFTSHGKLNYAYDRDTYHGNMQIINKNMILFCIRRNNIFTNILFLMDDLLSTK